MSAMGRREDLREILAAHFIMWRDLDDRPGEWFCECGKKFGFSDTAIDHQADAVLDAGWSA